MAELYNLLQHYDTLFLVDDSGSMGGRRWETTAHIVAKIADIAVNYDTDGVNIRFCNNNLESCMNLRSADEVMRLFRMVKPDGPTLTADILEEELNQYILKFSKNRRKKGLKMVIFYKWGAFARTRCESCYH